LFKTVKVGDRVRVRPGISHSAHGKEVYKTGDQGEITDVIANVANREDRANIRWDRTGRQSTIALSSLGKKFMRMKAAEQTAKTTPMLLGTTTSGYVFAIDLATGEEVWATRVSRMITGVKGTVSAHNGIVVAATDRCMDHLCYRYRNLTNPLTPGNSKIRGLSVLDGSPIWEYDIYSPVWNFVPQYGEDNQGKFVIFSDQEGSAYKLDLNTGVGLFRKEGVIGTRTQSHAVYDPAGPAGGRIYMMGVHAYTHRFCNPNPPPGILVHCNTYPKTKGWIAAIRAKNGNKIWGWKDLKEPPSAASLGALILGCLSRPATTATGTPRHFCRPSTPTVAKNDGSGMAPRFGQRTALETMRALTFAGPWVAATSANPEPGARLLLMQAATSTSATRWVCCSAGVA